MNSKVWYWPIRIGALLAFGLVAGLLSDGIGDAFAWIGLGVPVAVSLHGLRRRADGN